MNRRIIAVLFAVLSLAACNKPGNERRQAAGEILEGSVSDAMIHTDQIRSEGPYAAPEAAKAEKGGKGPAKAAADSPTPKQDKQKIKVSLSMFGRTTSVELDFNQVEKA